MRFIFFLVLLFLICVDVSTTQSRAIGLKNGQEEAQRLWDQAIAAKGGREHLYSINNLQLSVREKQWYGLRRVPFIIEALYVFPQKSWEWLDQRGTIFGFTIWLRNYELDIRLAYNDHGNGCSTSQIQEGGRSGRSALIDKQLNYLMETRWVKPTPLSVEKGRMQGHAVDIVNTVVKDYPNGEEKVSFALNRESHLPMQVIYHAVFLGKEYSGGVLLSDYAAVKGIQMPSRVGGDRTTYQFNVDYNPQVFELPPSPVAGIDAWKKKL